MAETVTSQRQQRIVDPGTSRCKRAAPRHGACPAGHTRGVGARAAGASAGAGFAAAAELEGVLEVPHRGLASRVLLHACVPGERHQAAELLERPRHDALLRSSLLRNQIQAEDIDSLGGLRPLTIRGLPGGGGGGGGCVTAGAAPIRRLGRGYSYAARCIWSQHGGVTSPGSG